MRLKGSYSKLTLKLVASQAETGCTPAWNSTYCDRVNPARVNCIIIIFADYKQRRVNADDTGNHCQRSRGGTISGEQH